MKREVKTEIGLQVTVVCFIGYDYTLTYILYYVYITFVCFLLEICLRRAFLSQEERN
jgi:hypothetical protein